MATKSTTIAMTAIHAPCSTLVANTTTSTTAVNTAPTRVDRLGAADRAPPGAPTGAHSPGPSRRARRSCRARCQCWDDLDRERVKLVNTLID